MNNGIIFQVETSRILEILSKEIYDSPLALLRENLQNAYDAVLMRATSPLSPIALAESRISISVSGTRLTISDTGIGMSEEVLRENFWKAGSSGKRTELARRSGVVGTFGIGAMANFGVCESLRVETRAVDSEETLVSTADRATLSIAQECITLERVQDGRPFGTTIIATLDAQHPISEQVARAYLEPYVSFVPAHISLNGNLISQQSYDARLPINGRIFTEIADRQWSRGAYKVTVRVSADQNGTVLIRGTNVELQGSPVQGDLILLQGGGQLFGLRTNFGLAPVPNTGIYQCGGYVNLSILHPTAGREALSRESIDHISQLVSICEWAATDALSHVDACDKNNAFLQSVITYGQYAIAGKVTVRVLPDDQEMQLGLVTSHAGQKRLHYYLGRDQSILNTFASDTGVLLHVSQVNPRRQVQSQFITTVLKVQQVPDSVQIISKYSPKELTVQEASAVIRINMTVADDYLLPHSEIVLADISHGVSVYVTNSTDKVTIYIARRDNSLKALIETYKTAYEVFPGFVKDFVRVQIYPRIQQLVPSSTKQGADALRRVLERNRDLYRAEESEYGNLESVLGEYLSGAITLGDVLKVARTSTSAQSQSVSSDQVGNIEVEMPDVVQSPAIVQVQVEGAEYVAQPPILRSGMTTKMKILTTHIKYPQLNNFMMLLGLSDRLVRIEGDFFRSPHTTKVIWSGHRVIYIFTEATGKYSLYYDIELQQPLDEKVTGGGMLPTTTLITSDRIYVPVPEPLLASFRISGGPKEFFVRFDTLNAR